MKCGVHYQLKLQKNIKNHLVSQIYLVNHFSPHTVEIRHNLFIVELPVKKDSACIGEIVVLQSKLNKYFNPIGKS